jgi:hypothetical protein
MNGFDGMRGGTGENTLSCGAIGFGEAIGACFGKGAASGNCGAINSVGSGEASGITVLGAIDVGVGGGVVLVSAMDIIASGLPHRGQNEACRSNSALQRGQRKRGAADDGGEVVGISGGA